MNLFLLTSQKRGAELLIRKGKKNLYLDIILFTLFSKVHLVDMFKIQDFLDIMKAGVVIDIRSGSSKHTSLFASHVSRFRGNLT